MNQKKIHQRHTIPNSDYPSFPCFQEEIKLKAKLGDGDQPTSTTTAHDLNPNQDDLHITMQDQWRMYFSDMQNLKDNFDTRRKQLPCRKKQQQQQTPSNSNPMGASSEIFPGPSTSLSSSLKQPSSIEQSDGKYKAHLIRTRSKDSVEEETANSTVDTRVKTAAPEMAPNSQRRAISDPLNLIGNRKQGFNEWMAKLEEINKMSRSTIDRIKRLENDIFTLRTNTEKSRFSRVSTANVANSNAAAVASSPFQSPKTPVTAYYKSGSVASDRIITRTGDKSLNTDIDMEFMNKILRFYYLNNANETSEPRSTNPPNAQNPWLKDRRQSIPQQHRRLTTTISRSVQIQTDRDDPEHRKSFQDKAVITDDLDFEAKSQFRRQQPSFHENNTRRYQQQESILDLPIIEKPMIAKNINTFHVCADPINGRKSRDVYGVNDENVDTDVLITGVKTPEPIVEMYSDSDTDIDSNFDDFEKNIFDEISKRAQFRSQSRIVSKSETDFSQDFPALARASKSDLKNSSTQTHTVQTNHVPQTDDANPTGNKHHKDGERSTRKRIRRNLVENQSPEKNPKFNSTSKIVIERTRADLRTEKREIILQTDIDKDGKVRRTTEIRNTKQQQPMDVIKIENECTSVPTKPRHQDGKNDDRETEKIAASSKSASADQNLPNRTQSAFDLFENDLLAKTEDDFLSNKAFSSLDISSKSPVVSEGYHSEQRLHTPPNHQHHHYLIEPPEQFRETDLDDDEITKSFAPSTDNYWEMNNETLIESIGNETNITTKSSTRKRGNQSKLFNPGLMTTDLDQFDTETKKPTENGTPGLDKNEKLIDLNQEKQGSESKTATSDIPTTAIIQPTMFQNNNLQNHGSTLNDFCNIYKQPNLNKTSIDQNSNQKQQPTATFSDEDESSSTTTTKSPHTNQDLGAKETTTSPSVFMSLFESDSELKENCSRLAKSCNEPVENDLHASLLETLEAISKKAQNISEQDDSVSDEDLVRMISGEFNDKQQNMTELNKIMPLMSNIMENLLSKDFLYPTLSELKLKYPKYLEENKNKISNEDYDRYENQLKIIIEICNEFDNETENNDKADEDEQIKSQRFNKILTLMQTMQSFGTPPSELVSAKNPMDVLGDFDPSKLNNMSQCCIS